VTLYDPIYTGISAMWIGTCLVFPPMAIPALLFIMYFVFSALREDRDMARRFPDTHPAYRRSSKLLVPFVF
jgi:protein-S-isoprenylcysteine O-methyltransferase Ste14